MKTRIEPLASNFGIHARSTVRVEVLGCLLALTCGYAAASNRGTLALAAVFALTFCIVAAAAYIRDPIGAFIWLWLLEVFNAPISAAVGYHSSAGEAVRQADELLVLLFVGLTVWRALRMETPMPLWRCILPWLVIALCGTWGAVVHGVPAAVTIVGAWLGLKLWTMIGITFLLPWKEEELTRVYGVFVRVGVFVAVVGVVDYVTRGAVSHVLGTATVQKFRNEAVHSIFPQPGEFSLFMSILFALTFSSFATRRKMSDLALALLFAGSVMLSLRLKGFLSLAVVVTIVVIVGAVANHRGAVAIVLVGLLLVVGVYSLEASAITKQISTYTSSESTARAQLYITGERIARDNFPFGAGFGRFASYPSRLFYSPVYYQYGLSNIYGLSRTYPHFIDDTSWPAVIGETGVGGLLVYVAGLMFIIVAIVRRLLARTGSGQWGPLAALCAIAVLLVDSLGDPTLFDWLATTALAMILGPALVATGPTPDGSELRAALNNRRTAVRPSARLLAADRIVTSRLRAAGSMASTQEHVEQRRPTMVGGLPEANAPYEDRLA